MGNPAVRTGLIYGLIAGVFGAINTVLSITGVTKSLGFAALLGFAFFIIGILIYLLAGRAAAAQTGKVSSGAIAGLVTGVVGGLIGLLLALVQYFVAPGSINSALGSASTAGLSSAVLLTAVIIGAIIGLGIALGIGALLGALGGLMGRGAYRPGA
jgi:drug/metabolite transporter (DMT)-like permease